MAKLRKMLGDINDPSVVELMQVMETQSKTTLARWAIDYVKEHIHFIVLQPLYMRK